MATKTRRTNKNTPQVSLSVCYRLGRTGLPSAQSFKRWVRLALTGIRSEGELSIRIVGNAEGRVFNRQYRSKDYATNVLSFPVELPTGVELPLLGDLVLCAAVIAKEAREQSKPLKHHYAHLTIHGVLHLLGYDHIKSADARIMEALEVEKLAELGIANPYI